MGWGLGLNPGRLSLILTSLHEHGLSPLHMGSAWGGVPHRHLQASHKDRPVSPPPRTLSPWARPRSAPWRPRHRGGSISKHSHPGAPVALK